MKNAFELAGFTFTLKNVKYGIHSEETVDFTADLYCGKDRIAEVYNEGHGGPTFTHYAPENSNLAARVEECVKKEVWLTCQTGDVIYHDLGTVADECLVIHEKYKNVLKLQKDSLVLEKSDGSDWNLYTCYVGGPVKYWAKNYPESVAMKLADMKKCGWTVLNTNISQKIYKAAEQYQVAK